MSRDEIAFNESRGCPTGVLSVKLLTPYAKPPMYGSNGAAGMDIYADLSVEGSIDQPLTIDPGERRLIKTGIAIAIPRGTYARVAPRSGLAFKHGIDVMAGVIDEDYRGEVGVILLNTSQVPCVVNHGDRIAQLIIEQYVPCFAVTVDELPDTARGAGGFGSTGK